MMPMQGPNDTEMYLPHEAYSAVGYHLFAGKWTGRFSGSDRLPHPGAVKQEQEAEVASKAFGDPTEKAFRERQRQSFQESKAFDTLFEALQWRKTIAWCRQEDGSWSPIPYDEWELGSEPFRQLHGELLTVLRDTRVLGFRKAMPRGRLPIRQCRPEVASGMGTNRKAG